MTKMSDPVPCLTRLRNSSLSTFLGLVDHSSSHSLRQEQTFSVRCGTSSISFLSVQQSRMPTSVGQQADRRRAERSEAPLVRTRSRSSCRVTEYLRQTSG